jgi:hypothetical protein
MKAASESGAEPFTGEHGVPGSRLPARRLTRAAHLLESVAVGFDVDHLAAIEAIDQG